MIEIDQKTALAAGKDRAGETLLQLIERFSDGNALMGGVEETAPASAFDPGQIIQGNAHFNPIFENFKRIRDGNQRSAHRSMALQRCSLDMGFVKKPVGWNI